MVTPQLIFAPITYQILSLIRSVQICLYHIKFGTDRFRIRLLKQVAEL